MSNLRKLKRAIILKLNKFTSRFKNAEVNNSEANDKNSVGTKFKDTNKNFTYILAIISGILLLGFIFLLAHKRLQAEMEIKQEPLNILKELQEEITSKEEQKKILEQENDRINKEFEEARSTMIQSLRAESSELKRVISEYDFALHMAGMKSFEGQGIRVTLADKEGIAYDSTTEASEIVHDGDLQIIVEFFKANYFDAIAVNGERISAMSPLLCTGPSVLVNRVYLSAPFVIEAGLESPEELDNIYSKLNEQQFIKSMNDRGLKLELELVDDLQLKPMQDEIYINAQVDKLGG